MKKITKIKLFLATILLVANLSIVSAQSCTNDTAEFTSATKLLYINIGYRYDFPQKGQMTLFRKIVALADASHTNEAVCKSAKLIQGGTYTGSITNPTLSSSSCVTIGPDGSDPAKMFGVKWDCNINKNDIICMYMVLDSNYKIIPSTAKVKQSTKFESQTVCGVSGCGSVPVKLLYQKGQAYVNRVALNWATASELNNEKFVIERSFDFENWVTVANVKGSGTSSIINNYSYTDNIVARKNVYYRITQFDFDGQSERFEPFAISKYQMEDIVLFTTGKSNQISIDLPVEGNYNFYITNISGVKVFEESITSTHSKIEMPKINPGTYFVRIEDPHGFSFSKKIFIF